MEEEKREFKKFNFCDVESVNNGYIVNVGNKGFKPKATLVAKDIDELKDILVAYIKLPFENEIK